MNLLLLAGGLLVFVSLLAGVLSARLGLPFLLVFLFAGMLAGEEGPGGVRFESPLFSAWVGNASLAIILLEGGISTRMSTFAQGVKPAALLATVGVVMTAVVVGVFAMSVMQLDWRYGLLLGAIVGSTDAAAVFSLLRHKGLRLDERASSALEMESGLNDPAAAFMVLALIAVINSDAGVGEIGWLLIKQAGFGALVGIVGGALVAWLLRKLPLTAEHGGLLSLMIVSGGMALFAIAGLADGSGFLAMYLYGVRLRARAEDAVNAASSALDGFAWAAQAAMFLLLGLLVTPHEIGRALGPALAIAAVLMFAARPLAVLLCLGPLGFSWRQVLFIGWVGLRGAVPIVLALFPLLAQVPGSGRFFNVAFAVVLASLLLQGTTLGWVARRLGVAQSPCEPPPEERPVRGRLTLDAGLPLVDVLRFFQLPVPEQRATTLGEWMTQALARDHAEGDGLDWHGAHFQIDGLHEGHIVRVGISLAPQRS